MTNVNYNPNNVSGEAMNYIYQVLRSMPVDLLLELWSKADPYKPEGMLLRYQISYTIECLVSNKWIPEF